jgi:hypothetical protein
LTQDLCIKEKENAYHEQEEKFEIHDVLIHAHCIDKYHHRETHSLPIWTDNYGNFIRLLWYPKVINHTFDKRQNGFWILAIMIFCNIFNTEKTWTGNFHLQIRTKKYKNTEVKASLMHEE